MESWERNVWALALVVFIAFVGFQFFSPFLPLYVMELGVTDPTRVALWSGVLTAVTPAVSGLLGPLWGSFADRVGRKPIVSYTVLFYTLFTLLTALSHGLRTFTGFQSLAQLALQANLVQRTRRFQSGRWLRGRCSMLLSPRESRQRGAVAR